MGDEARRKETQMTPGTVAMLATGDVRYTTAAQSTLDVPVGTAKDPFRQL
jgi:hypothetical protein